MPNTLKGKARTLRRDTSANVTNVQLNVRISEGVRDRAATLAHQHNVPLWYLIETALENLGPDDLPSCEGLNQDLLPIRDEEDLRMTG
ncbi:hypothetical protein [Propioniciclava soli]|uniref:hypothetical protein n=1 Tax=Propioniciclava soli TaxID=2775081 RepID=UPI001E5A35C6|nr:hypothetical protein [Propioniciclava soli]